MECRYLDSFVSLGSVAESEVGFSAVKNIQSEAFVIAIGLPTLLSKTICDKSTQRTVPWNNSSGTKDTSERPRHSRVNISMRQCVLLEDAIFNIVFEKQWNIQTIVAHETEDFDEKRQTFKNIILPAQTAGKSIVPVLQVL